jgi:hypothetical protein
MRVELLDPQGVLEREIADRRMTRNDVAATYVLAMRSTKEVDWPKINQQIIDRWSMSALHYIKERAWRIRRGQQP